MDEITCYRTADGAIFDRIDNAVRHSEARYANALLPLCTRLAQIDKYSEMAEFVNENLAAFAALKALHDDRAIHTE